MLKTKMQRFFWLGLFFICHISFSLAQSKYTLSGIIKDQATGEALIGASLQIKELNNTGIATNAYGFYSLTIPEGNYTVLVSYVGYQPFAQTIDLKQNLVLNIELISGEELAEIVIEGESLNEKITNPQMGVEKLDTKDIKSIPVLFGERDILKTLQLLPGIKSAGDGNAGFFVRGGSTDQNLILLDEATVYNATHLLGFFSTFNSDAIKDVSIYKGMMPAEYGGRLSSVLDVKMNEGNSRQFGISGGIGLISSKLNIEGPIKKDESSFLITGRRTYADLFLKASPDEALRNNSLYFYDLNAKVNYKINDKNRLFVSGYFGRDKLAFGDTFGIDWGNATATVRWNSVLNNRWFSNTSFIFTNYNYNIKIASGSNDFKISSQIRDYNLKQEFQFFPNPQNSWKFGINSIHHTITPGRITASDNSSLNSSEVQERYAWENAFYAQNEWKVSTRLQVSYGLRLTGFSLLGPGNFYTYNPNGETIQTDNFQSGQFVKTYWNLEPRLSFSYRLGETSSLKGGYARNVQNLHLLSNSTSAFPTDLWIPSSNNVKPEIADQISVGYFRSFKENQYEFSVESYYKDLQNQIDYKNGAELFSNDNVESQLLFGRGRAYGIEFLLRKKTGKLTGWLGYTLSRTERKIDGINNGTYYPARQDRTHDISLVGIYELSKKWTISGTWVYQTGNAVTFPSGKYTVNDKVIFYYTERNGYRMPAYHRLDFGATYLRKKTAKFESSWTFSLYNAYGRENAYSITFRESESDPNKTEAVRLALFKWIPSVAYNFKF
jgi:outer membrane cobalamin receptor